MTCLIGEAVDGPRMKSHTSMLEMFFVYTVGELEDLTNRSVWSKTTLIRAMWAGLG